ncbi:hypothetical protein BC831DRAFT_253844 [Entophlyctis helioformis]|nr:hypothetical protein BC831DRAFT_253844 [Entophlyctis helioformis]
MDHIPLTDSKMDKQHTQCDDDCMFVEQDVRNRAAKRTITGRDNGIYAMVIELGQEATVDEAVALLLEQFVIHNNLDGQMAHPANGNANQQANPQAKRTRTAASSDGDSQPAKHRRKRGTGEATKAVMVMQHYAVSQQFAADVNLGSILQQQAEDHQRRADRQQERSRTDQEAAEDTQTSGGPSASARRTRGRPKNSKGRSKTSNATSIQTASGTGTGVISYSANAVTPLRLQTAASLQHDADLLSFGMSSSPAIQARVFSRPCRRRLLPTIQAYRLYGLAATMGRSACLQ